MVRRGRHGQDPVEEFCALIGPRAHIRRHLLLSPRKKHDQYDDDDDDDEEL